MAKIEDVVGSELYRTFPNFIYLFHTDEIYVLPEYPDSVMDKMNSTFQQTNALSRTAPVFTYSNSGPRQVQIQLHLHRDMLNDANAGNGTMLVGEGEEPIDSLIRALQSIALPVYKAANKQVVPPMVAVKLGNTIFVKGVILGGVSIEYQKPVLDDDRYAQCNLNFEVYEVDPYDAISVSQLGSFRGVTRTFKDLIGG